MNNVMFPQLFMESTDSSTQQPNPNLRSKLLIKANIQTQLEKKKAGIAINTRLRDTLLSLMQAQMPVSVHSRCADQLGRLTEQLAVDQSCADQLAKLLVIVDNTLIRQHNEASSSLYLPQVR